MRLTSGHAIAVRAAEQAEVRAVDAFAARTAEIEGSPVRRAAVVAA
jgi:hypothetical protein